MNSIAGFKQNRCWKKCRILPLTKSLPTLSLSVRFRSAGAFRREDCYVFWETAARSPMVGVGRRRGVLRSRRGPAVFSGWSERGLWPHDVSPGDIAGWPSRWHSGWFRCFHSLLVCRLGLVFPSIRDIHTDGPGNHYDDVFVL